MIRRFGKYEVEAEIGRGGFGRVYRAYDPSVGRRVAIKVITLKDDPTLTHRFRAEAMAAGSMHHKNIVTIHEFGEFEGEQFLVMEYLDGSDLQHLIQQKTPLSLLEKNDLMIQVAQGLQCAHEHGIVHRDVKPANIMRLTDGSVKIMDFGIARITRDAATRLTQTGYLIGTFPYMAPEQFRSGETDALCDIWAYGVVYYEFITGVHPFEAPNPGSLMKRITLDEPDPITNLVPEFTPELAAVVGRLLGKNREDRYQSFDDFLFDAGDIVRTLARAQLPALIEQAEEMLQTGKPDAAQSVIRRILELDPSNKQARQWREDLRERSRRQAIRPRVDELIRRAEEDVEKRNYSAALEKIDSALRLDPVNTTLRSRLEQFREDAEKVKRADRLVAEARKEFHNMDVTAAFEHLTEALSKDPKNSDAARLLEAVNAAIADREAKAKFKLQLNKAKGLIVMQAYGEAISMLTELQKEAPQNPEIREPLAEAMRFKREQDLENQFHVAIGESKDLLKSGQYHRAVEILTDLDRRFPSKNDVVRPIRAYAIEQIEAERKTSELEKLATEIYAACDSQNFARALEVIEKALKRYPGNERLLQLQQSVVKAERLNRERRELELGIECCRDLCAKQNLDQALSCAQDLATRYPDNAQVAEFNRQIIQQVDARNGRRRSEVQKSLLEDKKFLPASNGPSQAAAGIGSNPDAKTTLFSQVEGVAKLPADEMPTDTQPPHSRADEHVASSRAWLTRPRLAVAGGSIILVAAGAWGLLRLTSQRPQKVDPRSQRSTNHPPPALGNAHESARTPPSQPATEPLNPVKGEVPNSGAAPTPPARPPTTKASLPVSKASSGPKTKPTQSSLRPPPAPERPSLPAAVNIPSTTIGPATNLKGPEIPQPPKVVAQAAQQGPEMNVPAAEYHGPPTLKYVWSGDISPAQTLAIRSAGASIGTLRGDPLPRFAGSVRVDTQGISVVQQPSTANGFQLLLRNSGTDIIKVLRFTWVEGKHASP